MSLHLQTRGVSRAPVGRMTAVMRAATMPRSEKVLRVAIVQAGRIIEERTFRDPPRGVIEDRDDTLFERDRDGYFICVPGGATGRIVTAEGTIDVGPHASRIRLDDSARGKVVVGKSTVLFQFVVPPPPRARPQLPLTTQRADIDWALTVIVAFSFLVHFGFIGSMFSDWLDPVVVTDDVVSIIDMTNALPSAVVEDPATAATTSDTASPTSQPTSATPVSHQRSEAQRSDARAASLAHDAEAMKMDLLGVLTPGRTAVDIALNRSDIPLVDLEGVARDPHGVERTGGELTLAPRSNVILDPTDLRNLGVTQVGPMTAGRERDPGGPKVDVTIGGFPKPPGITDIEGPIARLRPSFRSCYVRKGLDLDPTMQGKLTIDIHIAPNGDVADVTKIDGAGLSPAVEQCIMERAHNAAFNAPGGSGTHARVPIIFRQQ